MTQGQCEKVIIDTDFIFDPRIKTASDTLMAAGKGLLAFTGVDVVVDGVKRHAVEVNLLNADREILMDAVRRAGLDILESAEKISN